METFYAGPCLTVPLIRAKVVNLVAGIRLRPRLGIEDISLRTKSSAVRLCPGVPSRVGSPRLVGTTPHDEKEARDFHKTGRRGLHGRYPSFKGGAEDAESHDGGAASCRDELVAARYRGIFIYFHLVVQRTGRHPPKV